MEVYLTTCHINGKQYVGANTHENPDYFGTHPELISDIRKYGVNQFSKVILEVTDDVNLLMKLELKWQHHYKVAADPMFYNTRYDSKGFHNYGKTPSNATRKKMSDAHKGIPTGRTSSPMGVKARQKLSDLYKGKPKVWTWLKCPYCGIEMQQNNYAKYHGDNCKHKP